MAGDPQRLTGDLRKILVVVLDFFRSKCALADGVGVPTGPENSILLTLSGLAALGAADELDVF
jgi:hypothetical protein